MKLKVFIISLGLVAQTVQGQTFHLPASCRIEGAEALSIHTSAIEDHKLAERLVYQFEKLVPAVNVFYREIGFDSVKPIHRVFVRGSERGIIDDISLLSGLNPKI